MPYKDKEMKKIYDHQYYLKNKNKIKKRWQTWQQKNREYCNAYNREYQKIKRKICLDYYGHKCACCGETREEFLCFDHIDGGGTRARKLDYPGGNHLYRWLIKHNFPINIQILCNNCNMSLGFYGYCPHHPRKIRRKRK